MYETEVYSIGRQSINIVTTCCWPQFCQDLYPLTEIEETKFAIQKAYLVSCTNSRTLDIATAAEVFKSNQSAKVAPVQSSILSPHRGWRNSVLSRPGPRWGPAGDYQDPGTRRDDKMPSVLVFDSYLSGNFRK